MILLNQWCLTSVHCTLHSSRLIESSIFPNQISFDLLAAECVFFCNGFHFGKTNKKSEHMKQHSKKCLQMWSVYAPRFLTGTSFDKAYWQKGTFTALQSPNIYSSSTAAYEKTLLKEWSSPPLSASWSISSAATLTWTDDMTLHLCAFLIQFGHTVMCTMTSGRAYRPVL